MDAQGGVNIGLWLWDKKGLGLDLACLLLVSSLTWFNLKTSVYLFFL